MRIAVVGAGPTGLFAAIALARRGHAVTVVDRDPGPHPDGSWPRVGVMQFHHPHAFRGPVVDALSAEMPEVVDALLAAGAEPVQVTPDTVAGLRCRRMVFERVLRAAAVAEPGVQLLRGHAEEVLAERGRAAGLRVDGRPLGADLVLDASGRSGRIGRGLRAPAEGGDCGQAYVSRQYRLRPGAEFGPLTMPIAGIAYYPGYAAIAFPHDNGVFSTVVIRSGDDRALTGLRGTAAFDAVAAAVPLLAAWTDPARSTPLTGVLPGGRLHNTWCGQLDDRGEVPLPGLVFVGDTVCTTNPSAGRGITTSLLQVRRLLALLAEHPGDPESLTRALDAWNTAHVRPWFDDHVACDAGLAARWAGADVDLDAPLPSDLIGAAAAVDPSMMAVVGPYLAMQSLPAALAEVEPRAREVYATGWQPPVPDGPTRDELVELVTRAAGDRAGVPG
ncbi:NAD(P)/FAD-dependent oxidoreductase [Pseudonocardia abyssalis]|uniref:FAD-dependent oxidoreductase n=1 Tax=Pseudonocardia abyssalis TaxID=2792008 RepID=A0ABS6UN93_9PSEU|nr:FAD-dependent oxidoreductase [Pseudonocardia abyssalis]MBW0117617.1 FAD-dependent oxidoreductase [Pseudonocardia abyssalis]MBW0133717.1 FAD-dependent oxidoreductase [Pseudonocardia abyssalis]